MKKVGYLEGTNSTYLTRLAAMGIDTIPLGNGADNHGKYVGFIDRSDAIDLIITYFHKVVPLTEQHTSPQALLHACELNNIPVLIILPDDLQAKGNEAMRNVTADFRFVDPENVVEMATNLLGL